MALAGGAVLWILVHLFLIHPRLEGGEESGGEEAGAEGVLLQSLDMVSVDDVGKSFSRGARNAIGPCRAYLMAANPDGGARVISEDRAALSEFGDITAGAIWLGTLEGIVTKADVESSSDPGAEQIGTVMRIFNVDVVLPLKHRGLLLGIAMLGQEEGTNLLDPVHMDAFRTLRAYTTVALANVFLDSEAASRNTLRGAFDLATAMQESLMPDDRPVRRDRFELRGYYRPVAECGGDLWAWRELADDKFLVVIADATGHGAAPALLAAAAKGAIDAKWQASPDDMDPGDLLSVMNRAVYRVGQRQYMMTAFAAVIDPRANVIHFANGGQNFPFFLTGDKVEVLVARGNQLGAAPEANFETHSREMKDGDKLLLYTDGITEAGTPFVDPYGERRFRRAIAKHAGESPQRLPDILVGGMDAFLGDVEVSDDITMVVAQCGRTEAEERA
jgi:serine phosphatase RsbU (regulator of sigma subunit)